MAFARMSRKLRDMIRGPGILVAPGVYDALSARLAEIAGFDAIFHTGYGTSASLLAKPDVGLVSFGEMRDRVASIARAVGVPLIADADTGYGNAINVRRTVREYIWAGASGALIEDQVWPKRCGHMMGKEVIGREEMLGKIAAALDARDEEDPDFVVVARTDALGAVGFEEAVERARLYASAGADVIFIEGFETLEQMKRAVEEVRAPMLVNIVEGGRTPMLSVSSAEKLGFKIALYPLTALYAAAKAMLEVLRLLRDTGSPAAYLDRIVDFRGFSEIVRVREVEAMEKKYVPEEILRRRYGGRDVRLV